MEIWFLLTDLETPLYIFVKRVIDKEPQVTTIFIRNISPIEKYIYDKDNNCTWCNPISPLVWKKNLVYVRSNKHVMFMCLTNE